MPQEDFPCLFLGPLGIIGIKNNGEDYYNVFFYDKDYHEKFSIGGDTSVRKAKKLAEDYFVKCVLSFCLK